MTPSHPEILRAYRHLYQHLLRAVKYSTPSRYVVRDRLRIAFRQNPVKRFNPVRIARTLELIRNATNARGTEHAILSNWSHVWYERQRLIVTNSQIYRGKGKGKVDFRRGSYDEFDRTVRSLEESMGICMS